MSSSTSDSFCLTFAHLMSFQALIATGGTRIGNNGPFARYFYFNHPDEEDITWTPLLNLPKPQARILVEGNFRTPRAVSAGIPNIQDHTMVNLDGNLYLAGGGSHCQTSLGRKMLSYFYEYAPKDNRWIKRANMLCGREGCALVKMDGYIYAIGGWDEDGDLTEYLQTYDIDSNSWEEREIPGQNYQGVCDPSAVVYKGKILVYGHGINDGRPSDSFVYYDNDDDVEGGDEFEQHAAAMSMEEQREVSTSLHTLQVYDPAALEWHELFRQRHHVHTVHGDNEQYSAMVVRNDKVYRVMYEKKRERHCWVSYPRVHELVLNLETSAPSAKLGKEEEQRWLPEYHTPGAFCIEGEIYVNVNGCIVNTGQQMPQEKPTIDKVNFSRWLGVDTPEMANAAVAMFSFDQYRLTL